MSGADPKMLIIDPKVTTQAILGELDARGAKFATLRMRSPGLLKRIKPLAPGDYATVPWTGPAFTTGPRSTRTLP